MKKKDLEFKKILKILAKIEIRLQKLEKKQPKKKHKKKKKAESVCGPILSFEERLLQADPTERRKMLSKHY